MNLMKDPKARGRPYLKIVSLFLLGFGMLHFRRTENYDLCVFSMCLESLKI